jgi:hypothetical protein
LKNKFKTYLFITYIVTSKPKRISVAAGVVHIVNSPFLKFVRACLKQLHYVTPTLRVHHIECIEKPMKRLS